MFSLHICISCAFHGVAPLPFRNMASVPFLWERRHLCLVAYKHSIWLKPTQK